MPKFKRKFLRQRVKLKDKKKIFRFQSTQQYIKHNKIVYCCVDWNQKLFCCLLDSKKFEIAKCFYKCMLVTFCMPLRPCSSVCMARHPSWPGPPGCGGFTTIRGRTPLNEWSARCRRLYLTTHGTHNRQTPTLQAGFEPIILASERPRNHAFDRAATGISSCSSVTRTNVVLQRM